MISPLFRLHESDEQRIVRLLQVGSIQECVIEANYWLHYHMTSDSGELEPVVTAMRLLDHAQELLVQL